MPKSIKTYNQELEVKEPTDIEQSIDELLTADIEALKELNQEIEAVDAENIKQPK